LIKSLQQQSKTKAIFTAQAQGLPPYPVINVEAGAKFAKEGKKQ
jgi:hypothetical protein